MPGPQPNTKCKMGHDLTGANLAVYGKKRVRRFCRICAKAAHLKWVAWARPPKGRILGRRKVCKHGSEFVVRSGPKQKLQCNACLREAAKTYSRSEKGRRKRVISRARRLSRDPECENKYLTAYRVNNRDRFLANHRLNAHKRRAIKLAVPGSFSSAEWEGGIFP